MSSVLRRKKGTFKKGQKKTFDERRPVVGEIKTDF